VVGTVYLNPTIVQIGPSKVHPIDLGGLRPTLGAQPVKITVLGYTLPWPPKPTGPGQAPPPEEPAPTPARAPAAAPAAAPAKAPGGGR